MKVENIVGKSVMSLTDDQNKAVLRTDKGGQADNNDKNNAFKVDISDAVRQMIKTLPDEDEVRRDKVAAIRDQLAAGSYNISGKDVASKILNALKNGG